MDERQTTFVGRCMQQAEAYARRKWRDPDKVADCVAFAWEFAQAGRGTPQTVAWYAVKRVRSGDRLQRSKRSIDSPQRQRAGNRRAAVDPAELARTGDDPAAIVTAKLSYEQWRSELPERLLNVADRLAAGATTSELADELGLSPARISQLRHVLEDNYRERFPDV
ncbi:MAG: hypothetical protein KY476_00615 [Planctomycetes bacterium]|nr:hypothetical protein [Planctomycetota bacterium]